MQLCKLASVLGIVFVLFWIDVLLVGPAREAR